uniref:Glycophorin-A n=1 Tax=Steinernema glaseri TaxID=37863 RepID=A0A1I8AND9_9BILA
MYNTTSAPSTDGEVVVFVVAIVAIFIVLGLTALIAVAVVALHRVLPELSKKERRKLSAEERLLESNVHDGSYNDCCVSPV